MRSLSIIFNHNNTVNLGKIKQELDSCSRWNKELAGNNRIRIVVALSPDELKRNFFIQVHEIDINVPRIAPIEEYKPVFLFLKIELRPNFTINSYHIPEKFWNPGSKLWWKSFIWIVQSSISFECSVSYCEI